MMKRSESRKEFTLGMKGCILVQVKYAGGGTKYLPETYLAHHPDFGAPELSLDEINIPKDKKQRRVIQARFEQEWAALVAELQAREDASQGTEEEFEWFEEDIFVGMEERGWTLRAIEMGEVGY